MTDVKAKIGLGEILSAIVYIPKLVGIVLGAVALVEAIKDGSPGPEKKAAVLDSITLMWADISAQYGIPGDVTKYIPILSMLIDLAVTLYNIFWKKKA